MGKIKIGLVVCGIIFLVLFVGINVNERILKEPETQKETTKPYETKMSPEEISEWDAQIEADREKWREEMEGKIIDNSEVEAFYRETCTEMLQAWGLMNEVLWTERQLEIEIQTCIENGLKEEIQD